eukprot:2913539-Amphidinium_carterae.1
MSTTTGSCETEAAFTGAGFEHAVRTAFDTLMKSATGKPKVSGPRFFVDNPYHEASQIEVMVWQFRQCCKMCKEQPVNQFRMASLKDAMDAFSIRLAAGMTWQQCLQDLEPRLLT